MKKKTILTICALVLVAALSIGGTIAYLTASTESIVNTFTVGNVNITLDESDNLDFKMVPGNEIDKDPVVTVLSGSEACWLFVKIEESANLDDFITYGVADGWIALDGVAGVYYRAVAAAETDQAFAVLADDEVSVLGTVTQGMMDAITDGTAEDPTLTFTAYAAQSANLTVAEAWAAVNA